MDEQLLKLINLMQDFMEKSIYRIDAMQKQIDTANKRIDYLERVHPNLRTCFEYNKIQKE